MNKPPWDPMTQPIMIAVLFALLISCSTHVARKDGPPKFFIDERKIPNAVPKYEPLAKYGNMKFYHVMGKRYYVMKSNKNYEEVGTASWYGTQFHDHRTSSGERYNMLGMTAAHKTLPLPTYVEVTNLKNKRKIIVKVNDRGPFASNRIIDLSYVAAKKLGMLGHGTAEVRVKAIDPSYYAKPIVVAKNTRIPHPVFLQVGAFKSRLNAEKLRNRLTLLLAAPVAITNPSLQTHVYRVHIGPIKDVVTANRIYYQLKGLGIKPSKTDI
jgi:rare lipoprotein A